MMCVNDGFSLAWFMTSAICVGIFIGVIIVNILPRIMPQIKKQIKEVRCDHFWNENFSLVKGSEVYCNKCWKVIKLPKRG